MERVNTIPDNISEVADLANAVELALDEMISIIKRVSLPSSAPLNPDGGEVYYNESTKVLSIWNSANGEYDTVQLT
jgi:hypothetical protein